MGPGIEGIVLELVLHPNGNVSITGPIQNKVLCYGILEAARDAVLEWHHAQLAARKPVVVAPANAMPQ